MQPSMWRLGEPSGSGNIQTCDMCGSGLRPPSTPIMACMLHIPSVRLWFERFCCGKSVAGSTGACDSVCTMLTETEQGLSNRWIPHIVVACVVENLLGLACDVEHRRSCQCWMPAHPCLRTCHHTRCFSVTRPLCMTMLLNLDMTHGSAHGRASVREVVSKHMNC